MGDMEHRIQAWWTRDAHVRPLAVARGLRSGGGGSLAVHALRSLPPAGRVLDAQARYRARPPRNDRGSGSRRSTCPRACSNACTKAADRQLKVDVVNRPGRPAAEGPFDGDGRSTMDHPGPREC